VLSLTPFHLAQAPDELRLGWNVLWNGENGHAAGVSSKFDLPQIGQQHPTAARPCQSRKGVARDAPSRRETGSLRGSLEPLFDPGPGDDLVAVTEPHPRAQGAMLVPQAVELRVEAVDVGHDGRVVLG